MTPTRTQTLDTRPAVAAGFGALTARDLMRPVDGVISDDATLREVVERFLLGPTRHLLVLDRDGRCVGMLGPRHIAQARRFDPRRDEEIPVGELGCGGWIVLSPLDSVQECARMLVEHDLDAVPVLDEDRRALGIVTAQDIARAAADLPTRRHPRWVQE